MSLSNKNIILAVSGGIAAYKSAHLIRLLSGAGANIQVVMTEHATEFITPITLQALSGNPVRRELFDPVAEAAMGHIELARWADLILIAPATANSIAKISHGFADDLLSTIWLAAACPKAIAPAMNQQMWQAPTTQKNIANLQRLNTAVIGPAQGEQACGDNGPGRMVEPEQIAEELDNIFKSGQGQKDTLRNLKVMITAGPTVENIDPVRFISNRSSGKIGYAIAEAALNAGAEVTLISGPTRLHQPADVSFHAVKSAQQMYDQVMQTITDIDIFISCAAVADYRPEKIEERKIKKKQDTLQINLVKNPDIVKSVATLDKAPFTVGFAAETDDLIKHAHGKLQNKKLQLIVANKVGENLGFDQDDNELHLFWPEGEEKFPRAGKKQLAHQLIEKIAILYNQQPK